MKRRVFFSFDYDHDAWRASQIRNIGVVDGNEICKDNDWETIKRGGDQAIKNWIENQLKGRSVTAVLIGSKTSDSKWVQHEIKRSHELNMGILAIYIHNLKNQDGNKSPKGLNPLDMLSIGDEKLSNIYHTYDPDPSDAYNDIEQKLSNWIEIAAKQRGR